MTAHPGDADLPYLEAQFVQLEQLAAAHGWPAPALRAAIRAAQMPAPSYRLADGRELLPADYFALAEMAAGPQRLGNWFAEAYARAARGQADADPLPVAWRDYLSGGYGVCLRSVTPSTIVRKTVLVAQLERLLADPKPGDGAWLAELRTAVDALDALERPFCQFDRRFGPVTRDRLITAARERYLDATTGEFPRGHGGFS